MFTIWLARHGEAVDPDTVSSDFARTLTQRGRRQVSGLARWIKDREQPPDLILHSPLVRAQQTAETIATEFHHFSVPVQLERRLAPGIDTPELLQFLYDKAVEQVVCVGHQPDMSRCLAEMIGGGQIHYSPGSLACVQFSGLITSGAGQLVWMIDPEWFD